MRRVPTRKDLLREEGGFTLPEVLVAMVMMVTVMFALYAIFDMSLRVFSFGNDKIEAVENARAGLERMEREIRAAYPYDKGAGSEGEDGEKLLATANPDEIKFGNDLNANREVDTDSEEIRYYVSDNKLMRSKGGTASSVVSVGENGDLEFEYLEEDGDIEIVHIELQVEVDGGNSGTVTQTLNTDVALRNRVE